MAMLCECNKGSPAGSACASAFDCASGLCLSRSPGSRVCVARCSQNSECTAGEICGRFDFRGRDPDSGALGGDPSDVVTVCRPSLQRPCDSTCATGVCVGNTCSRVCASDADCDGRPCVGPPCGPRLCAPPCDSIAECPTRYVCDLVHIDLQGHGWCLPINPADAANSSDATAACDAPSD